METLVANFSGLTRRETVNGRKFIVAPLTMIVPGVLNGSAGPLLYPEDEVAASCPYWEGVILTDNHLPPDVNGRKIKTQQDYGMGYVQNPTIKNGKLKAEGWFDVDKTRRINPNILSALERGDKIELSTGLNVSFEDTSGIHNGRQYNQIVRKYRPDHLAILIGQRGACSVYDGCGVNNMAIANTWSDSARQKAAMSRKMHKHLQQIRRAFKNESSKEAHSMTVSTLQDMADRGHITQEEADLGMQMSKRHYKINNAWSEEARRKAAQARNIGEDMLNNQDIEDDYDNGFGPIINDDDSELEDDFENDDDLDDEVEDEYDEENDFDDDFDEEDDEDWDDEEEDDVNNAWSDSARRAAARDAKDAHRMAAEDHSKARDDHDIDMRDEYYKKHPVDNVWSDSARQAAALKRKYEVMYRSKAWGSLPTAKTFSTKQAAKKWYRRNKSKVDLHSHGWVEGTDYGTKSVSNAWSDQARQAAKLKRQRQLRAKSFLESQGADPKVVGDEIHFTTGLGEAGKVVFHPTHMEEHVADKVFKHSNLRSLMRAWSKGINNAWSIQARKAASAARWHKGGALEGHQEGDKVRINPDYGGSNKSGVVIQSVDNFHTVKHSNGSTAIYHESDLASTSRKAKVDNKSCKGKKKKKPVTNNKEPNMSLSQEQKDKLIDKIISNCDCYSEDDREALSKLDDRMLKSVANGTQVNNAKNEPIKVSDLPVEMQRVLNYGAQAIEADKAKLIDRLVANQATDEAKKTRREVLSKLTLDELQDRVADLPVEKVENQFDYTFQSYTPNFSGAGAGRYTTVNNQQTGPAGGNLGIPELDFSQQN